MHLGYFTPFLLFFFYKTCISSNSQSGFKDMTRIYDTTIVGHVLEQDSVKTAVIRTRSELKYYYGIYHIKIGVVNLVDSTIRDTLIIAIVYNNFIERRQYEDSFGIKVGKNYIFTVASFMPCHSDFPKLAGFCDSVQNEFYPEHSRVASKYKNIYRVIFSSTWRGEVKNLKRRLQLSRR